MRPDLAFLVGVGFIALMALGALYSVAFRHYRVDLLRQRLFEIRDHLFICAARGELSFESPAYKMTRQTLNGMIRFAHTFSLTRIAIDRLLNQIYPLDVNMYDHMFADTLRQLDSTQKQIINDRHVEAHEALRAHLIATSITAMLLVNARYAVPLLGKLLRLFWSRGAQVVANVASYAPGSRFWRTVDAMGNYAGML